MNVKRIDGLDYLGNPTKQSRNERIIVFRMMINCSHDQLKNQVNRSKTKENLTDDPKSANQCSDTMIRSMEE